MSAKIQFRIFNLLFIFLISNCILYSQHGVNPNWGPEYALPKFNSSHSQRGTLFNNMAVSSTGRIFVLTVEINPLNGISSGIYLNYSDNKGVSWLKTPVRFTPANLVIGAAPPRLEIDNNNTLHLIWSSKVPAAMFYSKYDLNLNLITDTVRIANKVLYSSFTYHLTVDKNNNLHAVWHEGNPGSAETAEVYYSKSQNSGNSWTSAVRLSNNDDRHSAFPRVQLNESRGDTIAVVWRDSVNIGMKWDIFMAVSTNAGINWSSTFNIAAGQDLDSDPDLLIDNSNRFHLFFHKYPFSDPFDGANVRYGYSDNLGSSWMPAGFFQMSEPGMRSHLVEGSRYDSKRNILWTFWKDERDFFEGQARADMMCSYSLNRGANWSAPEFVTDKDTFSIGFKAAALMIDGGVCTNYEVTEGNGLSRVYFRSRSCPFTSSIGNEKPLKNYLFELKQNYPNPFNPETYIEFSLIKNSMVRLDIFDINGKLVLNLLNNEKPEGLVSVKWNGLDNFGNKVPSGIYFYKITVDGKYSSSKKMILSK
ncbi:MAG: hypothetical protein HGGPFJEG_00033 [Ignavibacteria bacterium]|nr:hypothetical protein [Ignavibacteria bacterium]